VDQATDLELASLDTVAAGVKQQLHSPETLSKIENAVSITPVGNSNLVSVTATADTPGGATRLANALAVQIAAFRRATAQNQIQQSLEALTRQIATLAAAPGATTAAGARQLGALRAQLTQLETLRSQQTGDVQIVQPAIPPTSPASHHLLRDGLIAGVVGLIVGILIALLLSTKDERVHTEPELASLISAPVLARIPRLTRSRRRDHAWSTQDDSAFAEAFDLLRLNLQLAGMQKGPLVVGVTSPSIGDGKTTAVASLARSLALSGTDVVAVDFDLRDPMLHRAFILTPSASSTPTKPAAVAHADLSDPCTSPRFVRDSERINTGAGGNRGTDRLGRLGGIDLAPAPAEGVLDALFDPDSITDYLCATEYAHLRILAAGRNPPAPGSVAHDRLQLLFTRLREQSDYVLVDTSPVATRADASAVAAAADGVILVVDPQRLRRRDLLAAKRQLSIADSVILGTVVNRARGEVPPISAAERARVAVNDRNPTAFNG
jgi:Mrp family chromosome partitioning ATPase